MDFVPVTVSSMVIFARTSDSQPCTQIYDSQSIHSNPHPRSRLFFKYHLSLPMNLTSPPYKSKTQYLQRRLPLSLFANYKQRVATLHPLQLNSSYNSFSSHSQEIPHTLGISTHSTPSASASHNVDCRDSKFLFLFLYKTTTTT
jgi:hypothetical protein